MWNNQHLTLVNFVRGMSENKTNLRKYKYVEGFTGISEELMKNCSHQYEILGFKQFL